MGNVRIANVKEAYDLLNTKMENMDFKEGWLEYLAFQAKFYNYSFRNSMLIQAQNPSANHVAGFNAWKKMGRHVKKGQKSIKIFGPCFYKEEDEETGEKKDVIRGFRLISVFDILQTDGDKSKLPTLVSGIKVDKEDYSALYQDLLSKVDILVTESQEDSSNGGSKGHYVLSNPEIVVKRNSYTQMIKTLFHEYAHHVHITRKMEGSDDKGYKEIVAESVAYIVSQRFGLDTSDYSLQYINSWSRGKKSEDILALGGVIQNVSKVVIETFGSESEETLAG